MSKKRMQVILSDEAWSAVEALTNEANHGFESGSINYSDAINEMILCSKVDVKVLQLKHTDIRRVLKSLSKKQDIDFESAIKCFSELKSRSQNAKKKAGTQEVI